MGLAECGQPPLPASPRGRGTHSTPRPLLRGFVTVRVSGVTALLPTGPGSKQDGTFFRCRILQLPEGVLDS